MKNPKILIADDMDYLVEYTISHLSTIWPDATYIRASNGYEVFTLSMRHKPDLILLDWEMPEFSGMDALVTLKSNSKTSDISVIMVSGFTQSDHVQKALNAGAIDYLKKPIEPIELIARVKTALTLAESVQKLRFQAAQLEEEQFKMDKLLKGLLPVQVIDTIKESGEIPPQRFRNVSVIMADLVDFTTKSQRISPKRLLSELQTIFTAFDEITDKYKCTRIKTIGDAYLAVAGMWENKDNNAIIACKMSEKMRQFIMDHNKQNNIDWEIRIGINTGDIIAGMISDKNLSFDIFGDTVNTASRMQTYSSPMQINISHTTYELIKKYYKVIRRVPRKVKGKGALNMYYLYKPIQSRDSKIKSELNSEADSD